MLRSTRFALVVAITAAVARAQGTVLVQQDFEGAQFPPSGWSLMTTIPSVWGVLNPGECGSVTRSASFGRGSSCNYWTPWAAGGALVSPPFTPVGAATIVEFDYRLAMDASGDAAQLYVEDVATGVLTLAADFAAFQNDGLQHHASFQLPVISSATYTLHFAAEGDGIGDQSSGWSFDDVVIHDGAAVVPYCFGDGSGAACPCGNTGASGEGCANSTGVGAKLDTLGSTSVAADDLRVFVVQAGPLRTTVLFEGLGAGSSNGLPFHDGLLCAGTPLRRLRRGTTDPNGVLYFTPGLVADFGWSAGSTRRVQAWYRDGLGPCTSGSNLSHALAVTMGP